MTVAVGVLTVSDACSRGDRPDASGAALRRRVRARGWTVAAAAVVPDDPAAVERALRAWCDDARLSLILTTGGTGLGPRDVTPEASRAVFDREAPGIAELMRARSLKSVPTAALSRATAGTRGASLIINLPGSPKGAADCFGFVAPLVEHALHVLAGGGHESHAPRPPARGRAAAGARSPK